MKKIYMKPAVEIVNCKTTTCILETSWSKDNQTGSATLNYDNGTGTSALGRSSSIWDDED